MDITAFFIKAVFSLPLVVIIMVLIMVLRDVVEEYYRSVSKSLVETIIEVSVFMLLLVSSIGALLIILSLP